MPSLLPFKESESGAVNGNLKEKIRKLLPREKDLRNLAKFFNLDLDGLSRIEYVNALRVLSRTYSMLKYTSILTSLRYGMVVIGGVGAGLLLASKGEEPRFTVDSDLITTAGEEEVPRIVGEVNAVLESKGMIVRIPVGRNSCIEVGRVKALEVREKLGKKITPLIYSTFLRGEGKHFADYVFLVAEKEGVKVDPSVLKGVKLELRKAGDIRVDGVKLVLTHNTPPRDPVRVDVPGIGPITVNSPEELIKDKISILRTPLNWEKAPLSIKVNWGVEIVKAILDLRLLRHYSASVNLSRKDKEVVAKNIAHAMRYLSRVARTAIIGNTVYVSEPIDDLVEFVLKEIDAKPVSWQ